MFSYPVWSTWAQYKTDINESTIIKFAEDIVNYGFNNSHLEIDDKWENCYSQISNFTQMVKNENMCTLNSHKLP